MLGSDYMGLMDVFKPQQVVPTVSSILPDIAKQEIMKGNLPVLRTDKIFLQATEICHYIDKAIFEKRKVQKKYIRKGTGYSVYYKSTYYFFRRIRGI